MYVAITATHAQSSTVGYSFINYLQLLCCALLAVLFSRWRVVRDLVFPPHGKAVTVTAGLSSQTVLQALQVIAYAQQHATAMDVFSGLQHDGASLDVDMALLLLKPLGSSVRTSRWFFPFVFVVTVRVSNVNIG